MKVYTLKATGTSINGWPFTMAHRNVYLFRRSAVKAITKFRADCLDKKHFEAAIDDESFAVALVKLRLRI